MQQVFSDSLVAIGQTLRLGGEERHYLGRVLRARSGERVRVTDGHGCACVAVLRGFEGDWALLETESEIIEVAEPWAIHLGLCAPKGDALELALEGAVQLGVESITLLKSKRTVANFDGSALQPERLKRRLQEAARQCERSKVPDLLGPVNLEEHLQNPGDGLRLVASERGGLPVMQAMQGQGRGVILRTLIGPEGGFEAAELQSAADKKWIAVTLGARAYKVPVAVVALFSSLRTVQPQAITTEKQ